VTGRISNAWKSISLVHRLDKGNQNDLLVIQYSYSAVSSLAVFCAVAAYLWTKEVDSTCTAPYYHILPSQLVKVDVRFRDILKIWWSFCVVDFFRSLIALLAVNIKSRKLAYLYQVLIINDLLGVAAVIILHVYRFQYSGKWCSGDIMAPELARVSRDGYLIERGKILLGLVIYVWVGLLTYACILSCLITAANRRDKGDQSLN
jgi:hypothetical protein